MRDWRGRVDQVEAPQRHRPLLTLACLPVERLRPALSEDFRPTPGQPQQMLGVATVLDELHPLRVGHQTIGEPERLGRHAVTRSRAVEGKARTVVADLDDSSFEISEEECRQDRGLNRHQGRVAVGWSDRILREHVKDVREQELLVLLLMVASELDQIGDVAGRPRVSSPEWAWSTCARYA